MSNGSVNPFKLHRTVTTHTQENSSGGGRLELRYNSLGDLGGEKNTFLCRESAIKIQLSSVRAKSRAMCGSVDIQKESKFSTHMQACVHRQY